MIGKRIKDLLELNEMKQKDLAEKLGIHEVAISRYINNDHSPQPEMLAKIAEVLNTSTDYLLGLTNNPNKPESPSPLTFHIYKKFQELDIESLSPEDQEKILEIVRGAVELTKGKNKKK